MQPRCVQMPTSTSQFSWPFLVRLRSVAGAFSGRSSLRALVSESSEILTSAAFLISSGVRLRMNTGLPRPTTVMACPSLAGDRSPSVEASASEGNLAHAAGPPHRAGFPLTLRSREWRRYLARMRLALYEPDIPQNTGTLLRLAACLGVPVDLIGPAGFDMTDRAMRRAALDYLARVEIERHASFAAFETARPSRGSPLLPFPNHAPNGSS